MIVYLLLFFLNFWSLPIKIRRKKVLLCNGIEISNFGLNLPQQEYVSYCRVGCTKCRQVLLLNTNDSQVMNSSSHGALDVFSLIFGSNFKSLFSKSVMYQKH